jgi:NAD(P)H-dependent flavin oxidoreductase YrpB (nitropropane dioxygenase family)
MSIDNNPSLMEMLGIDVPIVQAPIGSLATVDLAAEVGRAGGIGGVGGDVGWAR